MNVPKKILSIVVLCFILLSPVISQESDISSDFDLLTKYQTLLAEHEDLLDEHEELIDQYDVLLKNYDDLRVNYDELTISFKNLTFQHSLDIGFHKKTKLSLNAANKVIEDLEINVKQLLSITDTKYFAIYPQVGYIGNVITTGFGFTMHYPKFPLALMFDVDYIYGIEFPINLQIGVGFRF